MKKRVLILSTSSGSGHKAAAAALEKVFRQSPSVAEVVNKDALDFTNEAFRNLYSDFFLNLVQNNPHFLGWWYDESDEPWRTDDVRLLLDRLNLQPMVKFVREFKPDITVCTHYMPAGIIAHLLEKRQLRTMLSIVTTDYDFHSMWLSRLFHRYFVALNETKAHLVTLGLPENRITVSGIPVDPAFAEPLDSDLILSNYDLKPDKPTILLSAGTAGGTPIMVVIERLMQLRHDAQIIVVCGKNAELKRDVELFVAPQASTFRVLGYTTDMASLMKASTLFIGKPGGLTASEAMAVGLPMAIISPIPGQEERNSDHLLEKGAAIKFNDTTVIAYKIDRLLDDPERLQRMRECAKRLGRPSAAQTIADTLLDENDTWPVELSRQDQQRMAELIKRPEETPVQRETIGAPQFLLYNSQNGVMVGALTKAQFQFLAKYLEKEGADDHDYYIIPATIDMLREQGADPELLAILQRAVSYTGEADVHWIQC
jgi:processive 1,2-diacylglycerol beta-glucosyltransferase